MRVFFLFFLITLFIVPAFADDGAEKNMMEWQKNFEKGKKRIAILEAQNNELQTKANIEKTITCLQEMTIEKFLFLEKTPQKSYKIWMKTCKYTVASIRIAREKEAEKKEMFEKKYTSFSDITIPSWVINATLNKKNWDEKTQTILGNTNLYHTLPNNEILDILGVKELLAVGISKYAGSSKDRTTNLMNAAQKIDGKLIHPGETFSMLSALDPFSLENGYVNGKVIVEGKTEEEIGGGICQTVTTFFRAWHNAGLIVKKSQPHSKVIPFYGEIGWDATVYGEPHIPGNVDLQVVNDTQNSILIKTAHDKGYQIVFLYGTKDRNVELEQIFFERKEDEQKVKWEKTIQFFSGKIEKFSFWQIQKKE